MDTFTPKHLSAGILLCLSFLLISGCTNGQHASNSKEVATIRMENKSDAAFNNEVITLHLPETAPGINWENVSLQNETGTFPFEAIDRDGDGTADDILIEASLKPGSSESLTVVQAKGKTMPEKRTHAELSVKEGGKWKDRVYEGGQFKGVNSLSVPPEHTDHSFYIRYEGPGWESDKVGYRFYLDWRNAIDIFGKTQNDIVLHKVGLDGFDSYHEMSDWGMDILKVGEALGLGSLGCWNNGKVIRVSQTDSLYCEIPLDGMLESSVLTRYSGWSTPYGKTDVVSELTIHAGDRRTKHTVLIDPAIDSICTGIVKHEGTEVIKGGNTQGWKYLATWGKQSLAEDMLGMAVFYRSSDLVMLAEDQFNHAVILEPGSGGKLSYYFSACWEKEPGGIKTKEQFTRYLDETVEKLEHPPACAIE